MKKISKYKAELLRQPGLYGRACYEGGGKLIIAKIPKLDMPNGGCGSPTHVEGTNGGTMPCGALLTKFDGTTNPYYCGYCREKNNG